MQRPKAPATRTLSKRAMPPPPSPNRWKIAAPAAVIVLVVAWALWPSMKVRNLDSQGTTIIAFGDSLTAGYGAGAGEDYPARLSTLAGTTVVNAGVSGDTTESALARLEADVLAHNPRIVIVGLGGNDFLRHVDIKTTEANLSSIVKRIQGAGAMVVLLGFRFPSFGASYENMYARVAEEEECFLIPDLMDGILSDSSLRSDAIHPNARGYQLMAERVAGPFRKLMKKANSSR